MLEAAARKRWLDRERAVLESLVAIKRAGADWSHLLRRDSREDDRAVGLTEQPHAERLLSFAVVFCLASPARAESVDLVAAAATRGDGSARLRRALQMPFGVTWTPPENVYVVEYGGHTVRKIDANGVVSTVAAPGSGPGGDGGPPRRRSSPRPQLAVDREGNVYVADTNNYASAARRQERANLAFAGTGVKGFSGRRRHAKDAEFGGIYCVGSTEVRTLVCTDLDNRRIRSIDMKTASSPPWPATGRRRPPDAPSGTYPLVDPRAAVMTGRGTFTSGAVGARPAVVDPGEDPHRGGTERRARG